MTSSEWCFRGPDKATVVVNGPDLLQTGQRMWPLPGANSRHLTGNDFARTNVGASVNDHTENGQERRHKGHLEVQAIRRVLGLKARKNGQLR